MLHEFAGFISVITESNKVIYSKGLRYHNLIEQKHITSNTFFAIDSSSKALITVLLGSLENDRELPLNAKVKTFLQRLRIFNET